MQARTPTLTLTTALALLAAACRDDGVVTFSGQTKAQYVVRELDMPTNNTQARQFGLDLNGDGEVDNQFGMVMGSLAGLGFDVQPAIDKSIAEGTVITLVQLDGTSEQGGFSELTELRVLFGADPQPPACNPGETFTCNTAMPPVCSGCGHHLTGGASFTIDPSTPNDAALVGVASATALDAGPGAMSLEFVAGDVPVTRFDLLGARARVALDGSGQIILAGGLTRSQLVDGLGPFVAQAAAQIVARDCCGAPTSPGGATCNPNGTGANANCGCIDGSQGKQIIGLFDTNPHDCVVTPDEVFQNSLAESLLAPDITVDGQPLLSVSVQTFVVPATF